jgi:hypothetical protein
MFSKLEEIQIPIAVAPALAGRATATLSSAAGRHFLQRNNRGLEKIFTRN